MLSISFSGAFSVKACDKPCKTCSLYHNYMKFRIGACFLQRWLISSFSNRWLGGSNNSGSGLSPGVWDWGSFFEWLSSQEHLSWLFLAFERNLGRVSHFSSDMSNHILWDQISDPREQTFWYSLSIHHSVHQLACHLNLIRGSLAKDWHKTFSPVYLSLALDHQRFQALTSLGSLAQQLPITIGKSRPPKVIFPTQW